MNTEIRQRPLKFELKVTHTHAHTHAHKHVYTHIYSRVVVSAM